MRRVRLLVDVTSEFGPERRKGSQGTVVEDHGHLLKVHWDEGLETYVGQEHVETISVLDDLLAELDPSA